MATTRTTPHQNAVPGAPALSSGGPISYALLQAAKAHKAAAAVLLREIGLYPGQELLLMHLWEQDERTQAELVRALRLDASTVTRMVVRLEERGVVRRRASDVDGRAVIVSLTERGREACRQVHDVWSQLEELTTAGLAKDERTEVLRLLRRLAGDLADQPAAA